MIEKSRNYLLYIILFSLLGCNNVHDPSTNLQQVFSNPPESAKPWVLWYWIKAAVSKEGITADLEAMKANGIAGAHIVTLQNVEDPPLFEPPLETLTPEWYDALEYTFREAKRLGIQLAMHSCDGFTVAGGPWITPEKSMQKLTWSTTRIHGGEHISLELPEPDKTRDYYRDIAVYAYPVLPGTGYSTTDRIPVITSSMADGDFLFLVDEHNNKKSFKSKKEGWIQYAFDEPFTCRSIIIRNTRLNDAANRLIIQASNDGVHFEVITRLSPPRNGWQDYLAPYTHSFPPTTARYFRFIYSREGVEPGSEDMEMSKFSPDLLLQGLILGSDPVIHQIEGKNGSMWRIAERIDEKNVPDQLCIQPNQLFEITDHMDSTGLLEWDAPDGDWNILRIGHTSTGQTNYIGGRGLGLECDKMNADIAEFQFDNWFGTMYTEIDSSLTAEVLKIFYVDSWECGSQNWTADFEQEFEKRRGYALSPILPVVTGLPLVSAKVSEEVLLDLRITLDELINERFFGTMTKLASE